MKAIDEIFTAHPFYGSRRIQTDLKYAREINICRDHVRRLMKTMCLATVYPQKAINTSLSDPSHAVYPYLLRGVEAGYPNHIWGSDITYVRMAHGFCYLYAIIDWFSRLVVGWELSATLETDFCVLAVRKAMARHGIPEISNTDQGSQFTDKKFIGELTENNTKISMDGRGRYLDNIFTERLWRSVKYEEVYLKSYSDIEEARTNLASYLQFYNHERRHQSLNRQTPAEVYDNKKTADADRNYKPSLTSISSNFTV